MNDPAVKIGMVSKYNNDWSYKEDEYTGSVGHVLKAGWGLGKIYLITGIDKYKQSAKKFIQRTWTDNSYDHINGGLYTDFDWNLGTVTNTDKDFWSLEQGFTGGMVNWYIDDDINSKNEALEMAQGSINFFMENLPDRINGGIFERTNSDGSSITRNSKSGLFKAAYHGIETGYFSYLYGSLFYADQPVCLYYKIEKTQKARSIKLWPIAIEDNKLIISEVKLDGKLYSDYDPTTRVLNIPAKVGGKFQVTFNLR